MPNVRVKENESFDVAMRRFKRACEKAGILTEVRRREFYEKPTTVRKRLMAAAVKRHLKRMSRDISPMTAEGKIRKDLLRKGRGAAVAATKPTNGYSSRHSA